MIGDKPPNLYGIKHAHNLARRSPRPEQRVGRSSSRDVSRITVIRDLPLIAASSCIYPLPCLFCATSPGSNRYAKP